ncbi:MAG: hypothetical protein P0Y55_04520 [Candidatus Cohnella colombiensis]|uniref:Uncharacterized protein n=1 Tax=Candidatus Cohnella colombiensis TaxID=3121368 RepID=A0AA95JGJ3_9BACL|nr:MAG: hypothetical protein P0Y55_04520 [Cohnella sp.]
MTDLTKDNLVLFPKTLDYYQIQLTKMLETEQYGEAKTMLNFLLQCHGEAERHHVEWQALLGWLQAAFPDSLDNELDHEGAEVEREDELDEEGWLKRRVIERMQADEQFIPQLLASLEHVEDPEQQLFALGQLLYADHPDIELVLKDWLERSEISPIVQFRGLQTLRKLGAEGPISFWREGALCTVEVEATPLHFSEFPYSIIQVLERLYQAAEISDPTLSYFAEELWKECVQYAYGTTIYQGMIEDNDSVVDTWAAALHQLLLEKLHSKNNDEWTREQYGITDELRFRYEQVLRWLRHYAVEPRPTN